MSVGTSWLRQAERLAAAEAGHMLDAAERDLRGLLPGSAIERGEDEVRVGAQGLMRRWIAEPALRFVLWSAK